MTAVQPPAKWAPAPAWRHQYDPWVLLDSGTWVRATPAMLAQAEHYGTPTRWHDRPPARGLWLMRQVPL